MSLTTCWPPVNYKCLGSQQATLWGRSRTFSQMVYYHPYFSWSLIECRVQQLRSLQTPYFHPWWSCDRCCRVTSGAAESSQTQISSLICAWGCISSVSDNNMSVPITGGISNTFKKKKCYVKMPSKVFCLTLWWHTICKIKTKQKNNKIQNK